MAVKRLLTIYSRPTQDKNIIYNIQIRVYFEQEQIDIVLKIVLVIFADSYFTYENAK